MINRWIWETCLENNLKNKTGDEHKKALIPSSKKMRTISIVTANAATFMFVFKQSGVKWIEINT